MREASRPQDIRALMDAQELLAAHARQVASDNLAHETELRAALAEQEAVLEALLRDWSSYLGSGSLEPNQLQRLSAAITRQDLQRAELSTDVDAAASATEVARFKLATADTHARLTEGALKDLRRAAVRHRDEAAARTLEDRLAHDWSHP